MSRFTTHHPRPQTAIFLATGLLLIAFLVATIDLHRESLWNDEAWTAWAIRTTYVRDILQRVEADVHPPLYFLLLGGLGRFTGDSVVALRWPSALFGLIGLAITYQLGKNLIDRRTGLIALAVLGTASFFVYYAREARMYSLLMSLSALATLCYVRWRAHPTIKRALPYSLAIAALLYTQYTGIFVIVTHILHGAITQLFPRSRIRAKWYAFPLPYIIALLLFVPWLPIFIKQMQSNPNGPLAIPVPTNWAAVAALILILTGGSWGLAVAPFALGAALPRVRQYGSAVMLLIFWLLITPITLFALNLWVAPVYQVRYTIAILPPAALLLAYGLRFVKWPLRLPDSRRYRHLASGAIATLLLVWFIYVQLTMFASLWPPKPAWESTIRAFINERKPLDATITDLAAYSPSAYYDRQLGLRRGIGLDLSWRLHTPDEVKKLVQKLDAEPSVWIVLPVNTAKSWQVAAQLDEDRSIGYHSGLGNMVFYRFDRSHTGDLAFQFGQQIRYVGRLMADRQLDAQPGSQLCVNFTLQTLNDMDNSFSVGLHMVDITGNINAAQSDSGLGSHAAGEFVEFNPCLTIPAATPAGAYHLELTVYNWSTLERLPILETNNNNPVSWGDVLMMQSVQISS